MPPALPSVPAPPDPPAFGTGPAEGTPPQVIPVPIPVPVLPAAPEAGLATQSPATAGPASGATAQSPAAGGAAAPPITGLALPGTADVRPNLKPGWSLSVRTMGGMKGTMKIQGQPDATVRQLTDLEFIETVVKADAGREQEVIREVVRAEAQVLDPATGQTITSQFAQAGQKFRVVFTGDTGEVTDLQTNQPIADGVLKEAFSQPLMLDVLPPGPMAAGTTWSFTGDDLSHRLKVLEIQGGRLDLRVDRVDRDADTGLQAMYISGTLQTKIPFPGLAGQSFDLNARVEMVVPPALGVALMAKLEGTVTCQVTATNQAGQQATISFAGDTTSVQVVKPSKEVIAELSGAGGASPAGRPARVLGTGVPARP
jgi:hypothetical protein